tara:strand:+ start:187 stop:1044 length:858 start_codon:yes stop_codon:yes gene_type:complete
VGIKNLAYSIIKYNQEENSIELLEWDVINLLKDVFDEQKKCDKCSKVAFFRSKNLEYHFCRKHKKNMNKEKPLELEKFDKKLDKCSLPSCKKKVKYICNGKKICASHKVILLKEYNKNYKLQKIKVMNCKNFPINDILMKIIKIFDEKYIQFLLVDKVLIELQPVLKGPKMKTISNHIYSYFLINGVCNPSLKMENVCYVNASNKLKFFKENDKLDITIYKNRKKIAILNTIHVLECLENTRMTEIFNLSKKKDDLADCLLQCLHYLERNYSFSLTKKINLSIES